MTAEFNIEKFEQLIESGNEEEIADFIINETTEDCVGDMLNLIREKRLNQFFDDLGIDKEKYESVRHETIKLHPQSVEWPLFSTLYQNHDGEYKVEDLIYEFHDSILKEGLEIGIAYGEKFVVEDVQNGRFKKEDFKNMNEKELHEYLEENREEI